MLTVREIRLLRIHFSIYGLLTWCLLPCVNYTRQAIIINVLNIHTALSGIPLSVCTAILDMNKPATKLLEV